MLFVFLAEGDEKQLGDLFLLTENNTAVRVWIKKKRNGNGVKDCTRRRRKDRKKKRRGDSNGV